MHVADGEAHAKPRATGHARFDVLLAVLAIFISGVSLFVAIEHGKTERDLVSANSWPFLRSVITNNYPPGHDLAIGFSNGGVGPAKVNSLEVFYKGAPVHSDVDLLKRCCGLKSDAAGYHQQLPHGILRSLADDTVIRPGEENVVLVVHRDVAAPDIPNRFNDALLSITFKACYCSILNECWVSDLKSTRTTEVKTCPEPRNRFDPNGD